MASNDPVHDEWLDARLSNWRLTLSHRWLICDDLHLGLATGAIGSVLVEMVPRSERNLAAISRARSISALLDRIMGAKGPNTRFVGDELHELALTPISGRPSLLEAAPLPFARALSSFAMLARAMDQAHASGAVHGALHPWALLINGPDESFTPIGALTSAMLEGTVPTNDWAVDEFLPYIAPEQTGRLRQGIDPRTDLYGMTASLQLALTGRPPFEADDALGLTHAHMAMAPRRPSTLLSTNRDVPSIALDAIDDVCGHGLAKRIDARYRTASGLAADLDRLAGLRDEGLQVAFEVGRSDDRQRVRLAPKVVARERERFVLATALERIADGGRQDLYLITGRGGVGKSTLARQVRSFDRDLRPVFLETKFEQYQSNEGVAGLTGAIDTLVTVLHQRFAGSGDAGTTTFADWLRTDVGDGVDLLPALSRTAARLVPSHHPRTSSPGPALEQRIFRTLEGLLGLVGRDELVVWLFDDLQWSSPTVQRFIHRVTQRTHARRLPLLVLATMRPLTGHGEAPLTDFVSHLPEDHVLELRDLPVSAVAEWIADSLDGEVEALDELAQLTQTKTGGNPFAVSQLIALAADRGWLVPERMRPDGSAASWTWSRDEIEALDVSDDVGSVLARRLSQYDPETLRTLRTAGLFGRTFHVAHLAIASRTSEGEIWRILAEPTRDGLLRALGGKIGFTHDSIQQACLAGDTDEERASARLELGLVLWNRAKSDELSIHDELVLELVSATTKPVRPDVELSVRARRAGVDALQTGDFERATRLLLTAVRFLPPHTRVADPTLAGDIYLHAADALRCAGEVAQADELLDEIRPHLQERMLRFAWLVRRVRNSIAQGDMPGAVPPALEAFATLGIELPSAEEANAREPVPPNTILESTKTLTDPVLLAVMDMFVLICPALFVARPDLVPAASRLAVDITLEHGLSPAGCVAFAYRGIVHAKLHRDHDAAYRYGRLADAAAEGLSSGFEQCTTRYITASFLRHAYEPWRDLARDLADYIDDGLRAGDVQYAAWFAVQASRYSLWAGQGLAEVEGDLRGRIEMCDESGLAWLGDYIRLTDDWVRQLRNERPEPWRWHADAFGDRPTEAWLDRGDADSILANRHTVEVALATEFGRADLALELVDSQGPFDAEDPMLVHAIHHYWRAIAILRAPASMPCSEALQRELGGTLEMFEAFAAAAPGPWGAKAAMLRGLHDWRRGDVEAATRSFDLAIRNARSVRHLEDEARAFELAGELHQARGLSDVAQYYLRGAVQRYESWGAHAKATWLAQRHGELVSKPAPLPFESSPSPAARANVEAMALAKASHAISSELDPKAILRTLLEVIVQFSGATRAAIVLRDEADKFEVVAHRDARERISLDVCELSALPWLPVESVLWSIDNGRVTNGESASDQPADMAPAEFLVMPLVHQQVHRGALYLDNTYVSGVFTKHRIDAIAVLAAQFVTSYDNARLYQHTKELARSLREEAVSRARAEAQLLQSQKMDVLGRLAGGVAHDFNNLLVAVLGFGDLLEERLSAPEQAENRQIAAAIVDAAERARGLTRQLLAFSRRQVIETTAVDLNEVLVNLQRMLARLLGETITLRVEPAPEASWIRADTTRLEQIIVNLAVNARDAMPRGGTLLLRVELEADEVRLIVEDTGQGMDQRTVDRVFDPFFTTKSHGKGTGLGLSTVYGIVSQFEGRIEVDSEIGRGSRFIITLPRHAQAERRASEPTRSSAVAVAKKAVVLLVEDEQVVRDLCAQVLRADGYEVHVAGHADEAEVVARGLSKIDLLLTDVVLPGRTGGQLAVRLCAQRPELRVLYMSGYTEDEIVRSALETGEVAFIAKPFSTRELRAAIREALAPRIGASQIGGPEAAPPASGTVVTLALDSEPTPEQHAR